MTRGYRPVIAIGEAKHQAQAWGLLVFTLEPGDNLPFHFVICNRECISLVRVRRLKYPGFDVAAIGHSCRNEIEILRALPVTWEIFRELWVRGPEREWYRYLVLPGSVEMLENRDATDNDRPEGGIDPSSFSPLVPPSGGALQSGTLLQGGKCT